MEKSQEKVSFFSRTFKHLLTILLIMGPTFYFGYIGRPTEMGIALISGSIATCFLNLDKFVRFKGAGFEAELQKAVEQAYATIEELKLIGKPLIVSIITILRYHDKLGNMAADQEHKFFYQLIEISNLLSLKEDNEIKSCRELFIRDHNWDHYYMFTNMLSREKIEGVEEIVKKLSSLEERSSINFPTKEKIEEIINPIKGEISKAVLEYLEDYDYYCKNQKLRRKESLVYVSQY